MGTKIVDALIKMLSAGSPPYAIQFLAFLGLLIVSWILPRTKKVVANSVIEGLGNILSSRSKLARKIASPSVARQHEDKFVPPPLPPLKPSIWPLMMFLFALSLPGCATLGGQAAFGSWKTCEVGKLPSTGQAVLLDVDDALSGAGYVPALEQLGLKVGSDAVDCGVSALVTYLMTKMPARGEASPVLLAKVQRGQIWLNRKKAPAASG
jgi:hypothetical protein